MIRCPLTARKVIISNSRKYLLSIVRATSSVDVRFDQIIRAPLHQSRFTQRSHNLEVGETVNLYRA